MEKRTTQTAEVKNTRPTINKRQEVRLQKIFGDLHFTDTRQIVKYFKDVPRYGGLHSFILQRTPIDLVSLYTKFKENGIDIHTRFFGTESIILNNRGALDLVLEGKDIRDFEWDFLEFATFYNNIPMVKYLVDRGVYPKVKNSRLLAEVTSMELYDLLISYGCDPEQNIKKIISNAVEYDLDDIWMNLIKDKPTQSKRIRWTFKYLVRYQEYAKIIALYNLITDIMDIDPIMHVNDEDIKRLIKKSRKAEALEALKYVMPIIMKPLSTKSKCDYLKMAAKYSRLEAIDLIYNIMKEGEEVDESNSRT